MLWIGAPNLFFLEKLPVVLLTIILAKKNVEKLEQQGLQHKNLVTGQAWLTQGRRSRRV